MIYKKINKEIIERKLKEKEQELIDKNKYDKKIISHIIDKERRKYTNYNDFCDNKIFIHTIIDENTYKTINSNSVLIFVYKKQSLAKIKWIKFKDYSYNIYIEIDNKEKKLLARAYSNNKEETDFKVIANVEHIENEWEEWSPVSNRREIIYSITESLIQYCISYLKAF